MCQTCIEKKTFGGINSAIPGEKALLRSYNLNERKQKEYVASIRNPCEMLSP